MKNAWVILVYQRCNNGSGANFGQHLHCENARATSQFPVFEGQNKWPNCSCRNAREDLQSVCMLRDSYKIFILSHIWRSDTVQKDWQDWSWALEGTNRPRILAVCLLMFLLQKIFSSATHHWQPLIFLSLAVPAKLDYQSLSECYLLRSSGCERSIVSLGLDGCRWRRQLGSAVGGDACDVSQYRGIVVCTRNIPVAHKFNSWGV